MKLDVIVLSETSQTGKDKYYYSTYMRDLKKSDSEKQSRMVIARHWEWGNEEMLEKGTNSQL